MNDCPTCEGCGCLGNETCGGKMVGDDCSLDDCGFCTCCNSLGVSANVARIKSAVRELETWRKQPVLFEEAPDDGSETKTH